MFTIADIQRRAGTSFVPTIGSFFHRKRTPIPGEDPARWLALNAVSAFEYPVGFTNFEDPGDVRALVSLPFRLPRHSPKGSRREYPFSYGDQRASGTVHAGDGICIVTLEVFAYDEGDSSTLTLVWFPVGAGGVLVVAPHDSDPRTLLGELPTLPACADLEDFALQHG